MLGEGRDEHATGRFPILSPPLTYFYVGSVPAGTSRYTFDGVDLAYALKALILSPFPRMNGGVQGISTLAEVPG